MSMSREPVWRTCKGTPYPFGVSQLPGGINFAVAVPDRKECSLLIYKKGEEKPFRTIPLPAEERTGDISAVCIKGMNAQEFEYNYRIEEQVVTDPYAAKIAGRERYGVPVQSADGHSLRGGVVLDRYDWEGDQNPGLAYHDIVMYAMHVRGFTMHSSSKVKGKGTFEGIRQKIPYLKDLGINLIELMPVYEFNETTEDTQYSRTYGDAADRGKPKINYWGYGAGSYFAPKSSYAYGSDPIRELKDLVKELHRNGMELVLEFYFPRGTNQNLMMDCVRYWVLEYHIDGVHVNSETAPMAVLASDPILSRTKIMSAGFPIEEQLGGNYRPRYKNLAEYNDGFSVDMRKFLKGDEEQLERFVYRIRRNPDNTAVINYITNHDGFTLLDLVSFEVKHNEANLENNLDGTDYNYSWNCGVEGKSRKKRIVELRKKQIRNGLVLLLLSQGVPLLLSGDEMGGTKNGNNNSYCQDNDISWLNWTDLVRYSDIYDFTRVLIRLRKAHPILHFPNEMLVMDSLSCGYPDVSYHGKKAWYAGFENYNRQIGVMYCGKYAGTGQEEDSFFYFAYNMHWIEHEFALPNLPRGKKWSILIDTNEPVEKREITESEAALANQKAVMVKARSIIILTG